jgi:hypothetical protein
VRPRDSGLLQLRAVEWAGNLPGFFPWLRPEVTEVLRFAEEVAGELGPNDGEVPADPIEQGAALLDANEQRRLVGQFVQRHPDQWAAVCADAGDVAALERSLVAGAVRASILERRLPPMGRLADLERGIAPIESPRDVLAVTLPPEAVWSVIDVQAAEGAAADTETEREWLGAIMMVAAARSHEAHPRRVQALAAALRRRLPAPGFPAASSMLDEAYVRARRPRFAETVVFALLPAYVAQRASYITSEN